MFFGPAKHPVCVRAAAQHAGRPAGFGFVVVSARTQRNRPAYSAGLSIRYQTRALPVVMKQPTVTGVFSGSHFERQTGGGSE